MAESPKFLVETALLTHGLRSVTNEALEQAWPFGSQPILVWVEQGKLRVGAMAEYLPFRLNCEQLCRINHFTLPDAMAHGHSGALTASGAMAACQMLNIELAVTCGMGGVGAGGSDVLSPDLPALATIQTALLATSPKDMLDIPATFSWLRQHGVCLSGPDCSGYIFRRRPLPLDMPLSRYRTAAARSAALKQGGLLLLNPIPSEKRILDLSILTAADAVGQAANAAGHSYHPAVNGALDRLTQGYSSRIQLESLLDNIRLAIQLTL